MLFNMGFFTKVDYSRQLNQKRASIAEFSGSTRIQEKLNIYTPKWELPASGGASAPRDLLSTGYTFTVGGPNDTSGTSAVAITAFSGVSGVTGVVSIGQAPMSPHTGGTLSPGISASTLQVNYKHLLYAGQLGNSHFDVSIDTSGNIVRALPSSLRYKTNLKKVEDFRYNKLLQISPYFFDYIGGGSRGYGLIAEMLHEAGFNELVIYDHKNRPDNIEYKMLSVALLKLIQDIHRSDKYLYDESTEDDTKTKVIGGKYTTNGEYLIVVTKPSEIILNSNVDKKIKIKSLSTCKVSGDKNKIDGKWSSIELDGDSCVEFVFVNDLDYWVITSSDGLKNI